jgi:hypothetical protein
MRTQCFIRYASLIAGVYWVLSPALMQANQLYIVNLNTAPLIGHLAAPFYLDFQLNDGSGTGDANNTATLSNFQFGGGCAIGSPSTQGGASGNLSSTVVIHDSTFLNEFYQQFIPGNTLSFTLDLTTQVESPTPDQFSFAILDNTLTELPTQGFFDVFATIDIDSPSPPVQTFTSDPNVPPAGGGRGITIAAPTVQAVPEPTTLVLLVMGMGGLLWIVQLRKELKLGFPS